MTQWLSSGWVQQLRERLREMWLRVTLFSLGGVALAALALLIGPYLPYVPEIDLAAGAVGALLNIIASTMLAVTTFSMSIIVGAYGGATANATPRATRLLAADNTAQNAVSVFIGSFLFSILGIIGLSAGVYGGQARVLLFVATLFDILLIIWALLRWVDHLNDFGRMSDIIGRIEEACERPAALLRDAPALGAVPRNAALDAGLPLLMAEQSGYVRYIDIWQLQNCAEAMDIEVEILCMPGRYAHRGTPLLRLSAPATPEQSIRLRGAFTLGAARSFDQDVEYGLIVLSEVAGKALSPGINDPGTAIEVLRAGTRVLAALHATPENVAPPECDRVFAPPVDVPMLYARFFSPIARDGAGVIEVQEVLHESLDYLAQAGHLPAARREAARARARAEAAMDQDWEIARLG